MTITDHILMTLVFLLWLVAMIGLAAVVVSVGTIHLLIDED